MADDDKGASRQEHAGKQTMEELEEGDPPKRPEDWPSDESKYLTYGGREGEHSYDEGPEEKMGPSEVRHHEDGTVTVHGEKVDNPDDYKGEPIPGGPTDPNAQGVGAGGKKESGEDDDDSSSKDDSGD